MPNYWDFYYFRSPQVSHYEIMGKMLVIDKVCLYRFIQTNVMKKTVNLKNLFYELSLGVTPKNNVLGLNEAFITTS